MKTVRITIITVIALSIASMMGCKKNNGTQPTKTSSQLAFQLRATHLADSVTVPDTITGLTWLSGTVDVASFTLDAWRNGVSIEIEDHNATAVNLFAPSPILTYVTLDTGTYKKISITANIEPSGSNPDPIVLKGMFKTDTVVFDFSADTKIKVQAKDITLTGKNDFIALVDIALDKLTHGITAADLSGATVTKGTIWISATSNSGLYWKMVQNLKGGGCGHEEWRERDHDGGDWHDD